MRRFRDDDSLLIAGAPAGPFAMNEYVVACRRTGDAVLVDAGGPYEPRRRLVNSEGLTVRGILLTHAHIDHVAGLNDTRAVLDVPVYLHPRDRPLWDAAPLQAARFGVPVGDLGAPDVDLADEDIIEVGALKLRVVHTPGHAPGHVCFIVTGHHAVLCGDLIFRGSIGRLDLPGAEPERMGDSLRRILELDDVTTLHPGHMGPTTVGDEWGSNPFVSQLVGHR
jgi:glyoxylase-like metal-dependent hydrolase (beta-lactamase superfamily II)